ncbi:MAG: PAS domain-containing protein [Bacteroidales bacterium]|nr:PAS domain-containing protein [Bacteroidales bacterium]
MRTLLCTIIIFLTAFVNYCKGQFEYVYDRTRCEEEQHITDTLLYIDHTNKQLWLNILAKAEKIVDKEPDLNKMTGSLARIYQFYDIIEDNAGKDRCLEKVTKIAQSTGNNDFYVRAQIMQAYSLIRHNKIDLAISIYQKAIKNLEPKKAFRQLAKLHCFLGYTYEYAHNEVLSIRNMLKAVSIVKNECKDDTLLTCEVYLNTAILYLNDDDFNKANDYILEVLTLLKNEQNSINEKYSNYLNIALIVSADIKRATQNYDEAINFYNEGINGFKNAHLDSMSFNSLKHLSDGYNGLGVTYQKTKKCNEAIKYINTAFEIRKKIGDKNKIANSFITLAEYYTEIKQEDSAYINFENGFNAAFDIRDALLIHKAALGLSKYYHKQRNYEKAYKYLEISNNYYQDVFDMKQSKDVAREEMDFIFEQEREYANKIKEKQDATIQRDKIIIYWAVAFCTMSVVMLAVIILLFYKKKKKNMQLKAQRDTLEKHSQQLQRQQEEITQKNQELRATTEMLENSNKELRILSTVAAATVNAIFITDINGDFTWFNDAFSRYSGIPFEELNTHPALRGQLMPPEARVAYDKVLKTKKSAEFLLNINLFAPSHKDVWMQTTVTPIFDQNNEVSLMILVCSDITELRETTKILEERNNELQMLSAVAASTGNSIYITTKEGKFIWFNDAFSRETHIPKEQLHTHPALKASAMTPETRATYEKVIATKKTQSYTAEMKHLGGEPFWVQSYVTPVLDDNGDIMMIVWVSTNITELHHAYEKIEVQNKEINASITYARRIQDAVQPMKIFSDEILGDHFIINMPRNIVSGDFHWVGYKNGLSVFAVVDCTGHGVPGAFISMLGQVMLNQTLSKLDEINSANILNYLRTGIIHQLHQRDKDGEASDSMDASMFVYDRENCIIDFSGAYSYAYLLRFGTPDEETTTKCKDSGGKIIVNDQNDAYLIRLKSNHMTIGIDRRDTVPFTNIKFKVNHGDIAYATTDGYIDQFGGEKQKRFYATNFEKNLLKYSHLSMTEQRNELERAFLEWKGDYEQTDDVHVLGIVL